MSIPVGGASLVAVLASFAFASATAAAQSIPQRGPPPISSPITDRFAFRGVYFAPSIDTVGRFDSSAGTIGTVFDGETDLGLNDRSNQGRLELTFRLRERHKVRADYFRLTRYGESTLTRPIAFRDTIYNLNDRVETNLNLRMLGFTYTWSALRTERFEAGIGLGLHTLEAEARGRVRTRLIREEGTGIGALPSLAAEGTWRISRRWAVTGRANLLSVDVSDVSGKFQEFHVDVQWRARRNLAFGIGYTGMKIDLDSRDPDLTGALLIDASGPEAFFRVSF